MCAASGFRFPDFSKGTGFTCLFGVPFVLIGIAMLLSPWWAYRRAARTVYAATDRRLLIVTETWGRAKAVRSHSCEDLGDLKKVERPDGSGDLIFALELVRGRRGRAYQKEIGFFGIPEVRQVEQLVLGLSEKPEIGRP